MRKNRISYVHESEEMKGQTEIFLKYLTFDLVKPLEADGFMTDEEVELRIIMSNGDEISFEFQEHFDDVTPPYYSLCINRNEVAGWNEFEGNVPQDVIKEYYQNHIKSKIKAAN